MEIRLGARRDARARAGPKGTGLSSARLSSSVIGSIYEAAEGDDRWRVLHDELQRSVRFDYCDFVIGQRLPDGPIAPADVRDGPSNDVVRFRHGIFDVESRVAFDDREGMLQRYMRDFSMLDPLSVELDTQLSRFVELADVEPVSRRAGEAWHETAYYNEFLVAHEIRWPARFITSVSPQRYLIANFAWLVPYDEVTREERRLVNLAMTHAARVIDLESRSGPVLGGVETLLGTLDMVDEAAFVMDGTLAIHTLNRAARDLVAVDPTLDIRKGRLSFRDAREEALVRSRLGGRDAFAVREFALGSVLGPRTLRAHVHALDEYGMRANANALSILVIDARNASRVSRLVTRALLTARESHAMLALAALGSEKAASRALDISLNTFRTHRRSSYGKLGIASRAELMELLGL